MLHKHSKIFGEGGDYFLTGSLTLSALWQKKLCALPAPDIIFVDIL